MSDEKIEGYNSVSDSLYKNYYLNFKGHSEVTSSHWRSVGSQKVKYFDGKFHIRGIGFGGLIPRTVYNRIKHSPETFLSLKMMDKYGCRKFIREGILQAARKSQRIFNFVCVKQALPLNAILSKLLNGSIPEYSPFLKTNIRTVCVIGDGYGCMTSLLKLIQPELKIISVNLGRTLLFDVYYNQKVLPGQRTGLITSEENKMEVFDQNSLLYLEAEKYELLYDLPIDLFINIASMQEMNKSVITNYFKYMRASSADKKYFYCCNRVEKRLPDGEIIRFAEYPWKEDDLILFDEICPWYNKYPTSFPPFWKKVDGPLQHRLVELQ